MDYIETISTDIKTAMKAGDRLRASFLRLIKSELILKKGAVELKKKEFTEVIAEAELRKLRKNAEEFGNILELNLLDEYLPKLMTEEEIGAAIDVILNNIEVTSMGEVMRLFKVSYDGKADNSTVSKLVREKLA